MISEGLCDIEDWSNDAEKSALHHRNKLHTYIKLEYFRVLLFLLYFWSNKYWWAKEACFKTLKYHNDYKVLNSSVQPDISIT